MDNHIRDEREVVLNNQSTAKLDAEIQKDNDD